MNNNQQQTWLQRTSSSVARYNKLLLAVIACSTLVWAATNWERSSYLPQDQIDVVSFQQPIAISEDGKIQYENLAGEIECEYLAHLLASICLEMSGSNQGAGGAGWILHGKLSLRGQSIGSGQQQKTINSLLLTYTGVAPGGIKLDKAISIREGQDGLKADALLDDYFKIVERQVLEDMKRKGEVYRQQQAAKWPFNWGRR